MNPDLFEEDIELPDRRVQERLDALLGLDETKTQLAKRATVLLDPDTLREWSRQHYGQVIPVVASFLGHPPLFVFAGDVGTGKSTLAETFAQQVATERDIKISVLRLSLRTRGSGTVGEMTKLLGEAFDQIVRRGRNLKNGDALVVVIDEADALAQSRELAEMHHEDRAGVNALIRGIDTVAVEGLPIVIVMCTNRLGALDPAIRRRAAAEFEFTRPDEPTRRELFSRALEGCGIGAADLDRLACLTGDDGRGYGHTYSDLTHGVLPAAVMNAFPVTKLTAELLVEAIETNPPTPPFST